MSFCKTQPVFLLTIGILGFCSNFTITVQAAPNPFSSSPALDEIRVGDYVAYTQIALECSGRVRECEVTPLTKNPPVIMVKLDGIKQSRLGKEFQCESFAFKKIQFSNDSSGNLILTIPLGNVVQTDKIHFHVWDDLVTIDLPLSVENHTNIPTRSEILAFKNKGGKVIIIDPGHGGWNTGAMGGFYTHSPRLIEKNVALDVALRLKRLLSKDKQFLPILTRYGDYLPVAFGAEGKNRETYKNISLLNRVELAKEYEGNIFISIHLNAVARKATQKTARGYEIWYLGNDHAEEVANEENMDSEELGSYGIDKSDEAQSLIPFIKQLKQEKIPQDSLELAGYITEEMKGIPHLVLRNPAIKSKMFKVVRQLKMPSVLVELAFLTHPIDHELVRNSRDLFAKSLYNAIRKYFFESRIMPEIAMASDASKKNAPPADPPLPAPTPVVNAKQLPTPTPTPVINAAPTPPEKTLPKTHTVQSQETLQSIADKYNISIDSLRDLNKSKIGRKDRIRSGTKLKLPELSTPEALALATIAEKASSEQVQSATNPTKIEAVQPEKSLAIPKESTPPETNPPVTNTQETKTEQTSTAPPAQENPTVAKPLIYEVQPQDTLEKIAIQFKTTVDALRSLNHKKGSMIHPGEKLLVSLEPDPSLFAVAESEPLSAITESSKAESSKPTTKNTTAKTTVKKSTKSTAKSETKSTSKPKTYQVRKNDTLSDIAKQFNISVDSLKKANKMKGNRIDAGDVLQIPGKSTARHS